MEDMATWWCPADLQAVGGLRGQGQAGRGTPACCSYPVAKQCGFQCFPEWRYPKPKGQLTKWSYTMSYVLTCTTLHNAPAESTNTCRRSFLEGCVTHAGEFGPQPPQDLWGGSNGPVQSLRDSGSLLDSGSESMRSWACGPRKACVPSVLLLSQDYLNGV